MECSGVRFGSVRFGSSGAASLVGRTKPLTRGGGGGVHEFHRSVEKHGINKETPPFTQDFLHQAYYRVPAKGAERRGAGQFCAAGARQYAGAGNPG